MMKISGIIRRAAVFAVLYAVIFTSASADKIGFVLNADDSVSISGSTGASLKRGVVTLYITSLGTKQTEYAYSGSAAADGGFSFRWLPDTSGKYLVRIKSGAVSLEEEYWYVSASEYNELMRKIGEGSTEDILTVLADEGSLYAVGIEEASISGVDRKALATALYSIREYKNAESEVLDYLEEAKVIAAYYSEQNDSTLDALSQTLSALGSALSDYSFYLQISDAAVKNEVHKKFQERILNGIGSADADFTDSIVLSAVEKCDSWTMLDSYLMLLDCEEYNDSDCKDEAAIAVAGKSYASRTRLTDALCAAIEDAEAGKKNSTGGGGGGSSSRPVSVPVPLPEADEQTPAEERVVFADVSDSHWAFDAVNYLRWEGIVSGSDFNMFFPDEPITRAEMTAMLVRAYKISGGECEFSDVDSGAWYYAPIAAAYTNGLVSGDGTAFRPNDLITRQDMAVMLFRFCTAAGVQMPQGSLNFDDKDEIAPYAAEAVAAMCAKGIISGVDEKHFAPLETATRAQAAQIIYAAFGR